MVAVGLALLLLAFALVLTPGAQRRSGSDLTPNGAFVAALGAGQQACQEGELLPADTSAVRVTVATNGLASPPLAIAFTGPRGNVLTSGSLPAGWDQGVVQIPLRHVSSPSEGAHVCLRNGGPHVVLLGGDLPDPGYHMTVAGRSVEGRLRYDYMRPGHESWLALLPTLAYRSTLGKSDLVRHWGWAAAVALMLLAVGLAVRTIVREEPR